MKASRIVLLFAVFGLLLPPWQGAAQTMRARRSSTLIWQNPGVVSSLDLFYGPGSEALAPEAPFRFIEEDKSGTSPKFKVRDARNVEWSVKLGVESQAETVATRLVWAMGYFSEEAYYFSRVLIEHFKELSRGSDFFDESGMVRAARFEPRRSNVERGDAWAWGHNPFVGTRELNGLRVVMMLLNNWDVKKSNNRVLLVTMPQSRIEVRYAVTDLGATFGRASGLGGGRSKNDVEDFVANRFVKGINDDSTVDFHYDMTPKRFGFLAAAYPPAFIKQQKKDNAMSDIPVIHARWIGLQLAQLTDHQLHDAFSAAAYDDWSAKMYVSALRQRINQLTQLREIRYAAKS